MDYIGISFLLFGLFGMISNRKVRFRVGMQVFMMFSPIVIAAIVNPTADALFFLLKMYIVALYFVCYFKSMRLTKVELVCFTLPVLISMYYFFHPVASYGLSHLEGRLSGIGDPNFTSLSLIISMCGAFGIYMLTKKKMVKILIMTVVVICCWGVLMTASRAGFVGAMVALCLFLIIRKIRWYVSAAVIATALLIALNSNIIVDITHNLFLFERFQSLSGEHESVVESVVEIRPFTERAWNTVQNGKWFIGGGPRLVAEWAENARFVPHNSMLDIGLAFGRASFYFYSGFIVVLFFVNVFKFAENIRHPERGGTDYLLTSMLFLSLLPMYMFLSVGLTMSFILWLVIGSCPLLHSSLRLPRIRIR